MDTASRRAKIRSQLTRIGARRDGGRPGRTAPRHVSLGLPKAGLTDADVAFLIEEVERQPDAARRLEKLHLGGNAVTDVGGAQLAAFVADSARLAPRFSVLNLESNALTPSCVCALAEAACSAGATRTLVALNVRDNAAMALEGESDAAAAALARVEVHLRENRLQVAAAKRARREVKREESARYAALISRVKPAIAAAPIAIVGGGIAGLATALALARRGYPCVVFERDRCFDERAQGYGLTMQQGTRACRALGIEGAVAAASAWSSRHFIFDQTGAVVAFWGPTFTARPTSSCSRRGKQKGGGGEGWQRVAAHNLHIPRQALRQALLAACMAQKSPPVRIEWGAEFSSFTPLKSGLALNFNVRRSAASEDASSPKAKAANMERTLATPAAVFCDGIHSLGRKQLIGDPLQYLGLIVILGIFEVGEDAEGNNAGLLHERVFQTSDGDTRIFVMPFSLTPTRRSMWQLTFPVDESEARRLSAGGSDVLRAEALRRCGAWHAPIPAMMASTSPDLLTGYPVYDRLPHGTEQHELEAAFAHGAAESFRRHGDVIPEKRAAETRGARSGVEGNDALIILAGDAAHCMSPLKGQGANQALLDAIVIADELDAALRFPTAREDDDGSAASTARIIAGSISAAWERARRTIDRRTRSKVLDSRAACSVLHQPDFVSPAFQVRRKMGTGVTEHSRAEDVLSRVATMRRVGVDATCAASGRLDEYAFGDPTAAAAETVAGTAAAATTTAATDEQ